MTTKANQWRERWDQLRHLDAFWVGAQELFDQIDSTLQHNQQNQLPYNLIKTNDGYRIDVAVAGFTKEDISVQYDETTQQLEITGKKKPEDNIQYVVRKIAARSFEYKWKVDAKTYKVGPISLKDGILTIQLTRKPDEVKKANVVKLDIE